MALPLVERCPVEERRLPCPWRYACLVSGETPGWVGERRPLQDLQADGESVTRVATGAQHET